MPDAALSAVNLSEVVAKLADLGVNERELRAGLDLGMTVVPFGAAMAYEAGFLLPKTRSLGLSPGDRACLALAARLGLPALTADRAWGRLHLGVEIRIMS